MTSKAEREGSQLPFQTKVTPGERAEPGLGTEVARDFSKLVKQQVPEVQKVLVHQNGDVISVYAVVEDASVELAEHIGEIIVQFAQQYPDPYFDFHLTALKGSRLEDIHTSLPGEIVMDLTHATS